MKYILYLKISLKNLLAGWKTSLAMIIGLPLGLSLFLGTIYSVQEKNSEVPIVNINIVDEDKTQYSQDLIGFLDSLELKENVSINNEDDKVLKLIIPKGYGENVLKLNSIEVIYENKKDYFEFKIINEILNKYHEGIYLASQNLTTENIQELQKSSVKTNLIKGEKKDYYKDNSLIGISFAASIMIMTLAVAYYTPVSRNINKKTSLAPISRNIHFGLEYLSSVIYVAIILFVYVLFYNITGIAFKGVLISSLIVIAGSALFIASVSILIVSFFKEKYGKLISNIIMVLPMGFQVLGPQLFQKNPEYLSPVFVVNEAFRKLLEGDIFTFEVGLMYIIGIVFFYVARWKVNYDWRMGK
ncbi:MAG: ABC transporter permease [Clostridium sp.]